MKYDSSRELAQPPDGVLPGIVPLERVLASSDRAAICLSRVGVYPTGLELEVLIGVKDDKAELDPRIWRLVDGDEPYEIGPKLAIQFADGLRLSSQASVDEISRDLEKAASGMVLMWGRGTNQWWRECLWIWPTPASGIVVFSCEWQGADISESTWSLRGQVITDAANRAKADLW